MTGPQGDMADASSAVGRILIVRPTALGDVARTVPALVSLRRAFPHASIDWLVNDTFADVVRHHPDLHRVIDFPRRRFASAWRRPSIMRQAWRWASELRDAAYDTVLDLQGLFRSGLFTWITGAPQRIGFDNARELGWLGYNRRYHVDPNMHTVDRMLALLEAHGIESVRDMRLYVGERDAQWRDALLREHGEGPYAVIAPTARWRCKCWPIERFGDIAQRLVNDGRIARLFIIASPDEQDQLAPLRQRFANNAAVAFPATTVGGLMALISKAAIVLCNDSAPLHIAVGFDRPIVTIFGPTDPALVGPYRRSETIVQPPNLRPEDTRDYRRRPNDQSLIARVTPNMVWSKIEAMRWE